LNLRPEHYECPALPSELHRRRWSFSFQIRMTPYRATEYIRTIRFAP